MEKNKMENPWKDLKQTNGEYIAERDIECIKNTPALRGALVFNTLPWPYMGDPEKATVYVLTTSTKAEDAFQAANEENRQEAIKKNLAHEHNNDCFPLVALDSRFNGTDLQKWWMNQLINLTGRTSIKDVANSVFIAQYVPYGHHNTKNLPELPSQEYTFSLVRAAMEDKKIIVLMFPKKKWFKAIEGLENYPNLCTLRDPGVVIGPGAIIGGVNFDDIVMAVNKAKGSD